MKKEIPSIKAELDFLDKNEHEIYCVADWVQTSIEGKMTSVRIISIHDDGIVVSTSKDRYYNLLNVNKILENLHTALSKSKEIYSTKSALCMQYAALLIEIDNAIVRLNIEKNFLKNAVITIKGEWHVDYKKWAELIREAGKNWGYKDFNKTDDVCYFYPGFEYKQFIEEHERYWEALHEKLDALVNILGELDSYINRGKIATKEHHPVKPVTDDVEQSPLFISYSWANSEEIDSLCRELNKANIPYSRDTEDCGYRYNIRRYEEAIGKGAKILAYISDKYIKSINCMYELALVFMHGDVENRLFPIITIDNCRDSIFLKGLLEFWESQYQQKKTILNDLPSGASLQAILELGYCGHIISEIPKIVNYLSDVNTLTIEKLSENHFELLMKKIMHR